MSLGHRSLTRRQAVGMFAAGTAAAIVPTTLLARQEASPAAEEGGMPPLPEGATVVAEGLWNPGNLVFGADGTLYIAETGVAGTPPETMPATPGAMGPEPLVPPQVSQVAPDGTLSVLTADVGGVGIAFFDGEVYVANGGTSVSMGLTPTASENTINAVNVETGEVRFIAELGAYEAEFNPDGTDVNPNLYGLDITPEGVIYVADAGGNAIYQVNADGTFTLFAVVPDLTALTGAEPDPEMGARQAVPTSVVIDDGGYVNVGLLGEAWDGPSILAYAPDATYTEGVSGIPVLVSMALGPDGLMYATSLTADFSGEMPAPGNVFRINADGVIEPVVEGLLFPHGITFDAEGNLYVTVNSIISGPDAPLGQVLRFDGIAS
jgi:hypothetical protein